MKLLKCQNPCLTCSFSKDGKRANTMDCILCDLFLDMERSPCNWCSNAHLDKAIDGGTCDICMLRKMYDASITDPRSINHLKMMKYDRVRYNRIDKMVPKLTEKSSSPMQSFKETEEKLLGFSAEAGYGDDYINLIFDLMITKGLSITKIAKIAGVAGSTIARRIPNTTAGLLKIGIRVPKCIVCGRAIDRYYSDTGVYETYSQYFKRQYCSKECYKDDK